MDNVVNLVKSMSIRGGLDAARLSNKNDQNEVANPVGGDTDVRLKCAVGQKQITV